MIQNLVDMCLGVLQKFLEKEKYKENIILNKGITSISVHLNK